ncbi:MAG: hypothetical protein ACI9R3_006373 [Verrucomicrobiales bacterium]|jgi:hypothetical protein
MQCVCGKSGWRRRRVAERLGLRSEREPTEAEVRHRARRRPCPQSQEVASGLEKVTANCYHYHVMSRAIEGRFIFDELGKERFRQLLEAHAEMAGIDVFTGCCMSNHFHLLVQVPHPEQSHAKLDDDEILRRLGLVMTTERVKEVRQMIERMKEQSPTLGYVEYRETLLARIFDVSVFMHTFRTLPGNGCDR